MPSYLFWIFALWMLCFGAAALMQRNPVNGAICLVLSLLGLACLFFSLDAYFLGIIQITVYAGAVMVLFLFILMLLDLRPQSSRKPAWIPLSLGTLLALGFAAAVFRVVRAYGAHAMPALGPGPLRDTANMGRALFGASNLPLQILAVLVLAASIGVVVLSKKELK